jgi:hypothetical protein
LDQLALDHDAGATCVHRARVALIYVHVEPGTVEGKAGAQAADRTPGDRNLQGLALRRAKFSM